MRFLSFFALIVAATATVQQNERAFEDTIINFLECLRGEMLVGWPDFGIPSLEPLEINDLTLDLGVVGVEGISGTIRVFDGIISGLTGFEYDNIKGTIGLIPPSYTIQMELNFPKVNIDTGYEATDVVISAIPLETFGAGTLALEANNFRATVDLKATILGGIGLEYLDLWISMDPLSAFKITGIRNDEEYSALISEELLAEGHNKIAELAGTVHDMAETILMDLINNGGGGEEGGFLSGIIDRCL